MFAHFLVVVQALILMGMMAYEDPSHIYIGILRIYYLKLGT